MTLQEAAEACRIAKANEAAARQKFEQCDKAAMDAGDELRRCEAAYRNARIALLEAAGL